MVKRRSLLASRKLLNSPEIREETPPPSCLRTVRLSAIAVLILTGGSLNAWAAPPKIGAIHPPAIQRGVGGTLQFGGKELAGAPELILPFSAEVRIEGGGKEAFNVQVIPSPGTPTGVYPVRVRTDEGISNLRLLNVTDVPVIRVQESNGRYKNGTLDLDSTQPIPIPCMIAGYRLVRDVDGFRFDVAAGDRLTLSTETWRTGLTPDPSLHLRDSRGKRLNYAHDTPTLQLDERLDHTFREAGTHYLEVQSTGGGGWNNHYLVHLGAMDYVRSVFPLGGRRGEKVSLELTTRDGQVSTREVTVPADPWCDQWRLPLPEYPGSLPWQLASGDYPEIMEDAGRTEPQTIAWPATVNGRIGQPGEQDLYRLAVQPQQKIRVLVEAYHLGSALDGYLMVYDPVGKKLLGKNDDMVGRGLPDPGVDFEVPADVKEVVVAVRSTVNHGGPAHSYRLTIEPGGPDFLLRLGKKQNPTNEEDVGWHRMDLSDTLNLTVGQESKLRLSVRRSAKDDDPHYSGPVQGYTGPISIKAHELPPGVTAQPLTIPADSTDAELVFTTTSDVPQQPFEIVVVGEATRPDGTQIRRIAERRIYISTPASTNLPWNWRVQKVTCVTTRPAAAVAAQP